MKLERKLYGEVMTPIDLVEEMLDGLPKEVWSNPKLKWLDPANGCGIFPAVILKRLMIGLATWEPDEERRYKHIMEKMLHVCELQPKNMFIYLCAFDPKDKYALNIYTGSFLTEEFDQHAQEIWGTEKFDVIVGNPPYQKESEGGTRDIPIYQHFVEKAKNKQAYLLALVIPSRWMASGLGLKDFRQTTLKDKSISHLVNYPAANEIFPTVKIKAGVCHFLRNKTHTGDCAVTTIRNGKSYGPIARNLDEHDIFVRDSRAISILNKVLTHKEESINKILAKDKEFGWTSNFEEFHGEQKQGDVPLYHIRKMKRDVGYVERKQIGKSSHLVDTWKVLVPKAYGGDGLPNPILGKPLIAPSPSVCTQSFLFFNVGSLKEAESLQSYYTTRFFRFLVSLRKITQDATHATYTWVPLQIWDRNWTDKDLFKKYKISPEEQEFITTQVREMNLQNPIGGSQ